MTLLTQNEGITLLALFGLTMIFLVWRRSHGQSHKDGFLVADRELPLWRGAFSIAVSWIWAPAIFICSLQAFTKGLPGIFWFTAPNIVCFFIFAPFAIRLRKLLPSGYTIAEFIQRRFPNDTKTHLIFLAVFFGYQFGAVIINSLAGGTLLHIVSGIDVHIAIILMSLIALTYSLMSGLKASVYTDVIQMVMILLIAFVLVPWCLFETQGIQTVSTGLAGVDGKHGNLFDPWIAFTMGIPMTFGLIAGPFSDQMFFQRAWAVKKEFVVRTFVFGGLLFGIVPIALSLLGFIGATLVQEGVLVVGDPQMVGPLVIGELLPKPALYLFCLMAFAGLCSTMDSGYCAGSSLGAIDIYKQYIHPTASDKQILTFSRWFMIFMAVVGTCLALLQPKLLWLFLIYGAMASAGLFPVMFAISSKRVTANGAFWAVCLSLLIGTPLSIYANITEDPYLIVTAAVTSIAVGLLTCVLSSTLNKSEPFSFESLHKA